MFIRTGRVIDQLSMKLIILTVSHVIRNQVRAILVRISSTMGSDCVISDIGMFDIMEQEIEIKMPVTPKFR